MPQMFPQNFSVIDAARMSIAQVRHDDRRQPFGPRVDHQACTLPRMWALSKRWSIAIPVVAFCWTL
jgi:hypothetical protein